MTGFVSHIQRASVSDGPGIRTTVFLSGCPLKCGWCHNPETRGRGGPVLLFYADKCAGCGACAAVCRKGAHVFTRSRGEDDSDSIRESRKTLYPDGNIIVHTPDRARCSGCGACARACPADALALRGAKTETAYVVAEVLRDKPFYDSTGGGVTVSGGEPLFQFEFTRELLAKSRDNGVRTCLDTSGWGGRAVELTPLVNMFLWDIKETDEARHHKYTGVGLGPILDSLRAVDDAGATIRLRCPIIPGVNARAEHMVAIGKLVNSLRGVEGIDLIAYHNLGEAKQGAVGETPVRFAQLTESDRADLLGVLAASARVPVRWHI
jgi:pyruvate formate lyase activating enzyme